MRPRYATDVMILCYGATTSQTPSVDNVAHAANGEFPARHPIAAPPCQAQVGSVARILELS